MKSCTAIIKTFLRDDYFFECYRSLKETYPDIKALVADSGNDSEVKTKFIEDNKVNYYKLPFDSGICVGRNTLIKKVKTKYVLIGDDDFKYTDTAKVQEMIDFLEANPEYDLIGGRIKENGKVRDYQGFMNIKGTTFNLEKLELIDYEHCDKSGLDYKPCDITFNFFVARTKAVKQVLWDEKIKVRYEHSSFFMDFKSAGHKVAFSPDPIVIHKPWGIKPDKAYINYRNRFNDNKVFFNRFDVERIIDMNNRVAVFDAEGYADIAFLIKTFERYDCLERLLFSIAKYYPNANIFIADDGQNFDSKYYKDLWERLYKEGLTKKPTAYNIEYDSGLSYSRNFLVKTVRDKFKYLLILDDDFEFTEETRIRKMKELLESDLTIGLVGGVVVDNGTADRHFEHNFEIIDETLYHRADTSEMKEINGIKYKTLDCVLNFCLINHSLTYSVLWDDKIKIQGEHSVKGDTPILINNDNVLSCIVVKDLMPNCFNGKVKKYNLQKQNIKVWTSKGWEKINKVIAHKSDERMVAVNSYGGFVECTEHHSLVIDDKEISPNEIYKGDKIELVKYPKLPNKMNIDKDFAWTMGFFLAEGCLSYGKKGDCKISITNRKKDELEKCIRGFNKCGIDAKLLNVDVESRRDRCNFLVINRPKDYIGIFDQFYDKERRKKIPNNIFLWDKKSRLEFFKGFIAGDGDHNKEGNISFSQKNLITINGLLWLVNDIYPNFSIRQRENKYGKWFCCSILKNKDKRCKDSNILKSKKYYDYNDLVYDIEVDANHHTFTGGVGNVNLHNTDFFLRLKETPWKVAYCPEVRVNHFTKLDPEYKKKRKRNEFLIYMMKKHNLKKMEYLNGFKYELSELELLTKSRNV